MGKLQRRQKELKNKKGFFEKINFIDESLSRMVGGKKKNKRKDT